MGCRRTLNHGCLSSQVLGGHGPYPLLVEPPGGDYWVQNGEYEVARGEDGVWRAPEICTEHYTLQADKTAFVYGRYFRKQASCNGGVMLCM